jgi:hypothetical protein
MDVDVDVDVDVEEVDARSGKRRRGRLREGQEMDTLFPLDGRGDGSGGARRPAGTAASPGTGEARLRRFYSRADLEGGTATRGPPTLSKRTAPAWQ